MILLEKKYKKIIIIILVTVLIVVPVAYFNPLLHLSKEFGKMDSDLKNIFITISMALISGSLYVLRNKPKVNVLEQFEAIQLVLLIIIPSVSIYSYILKIPENYSFAIGVYVTAVMIWFFIVFLKQKLVEGSNIDKRFTLTISYIMAVLVSYGIFAFWQLHEYHKLLAQVH